MFYNTKIQTPCYGCLRLKDASAVQTGTQALVGFSARKDWINDRYHDNYLYSGSDEGI